MDGQRPAARILLEPEVDDPCPDVPLLFLLETTDLPLLPPGVDVEHDEVDTLVRRGDIESMSKAIEVTAGALELRRLRWAWAEFWAGKVRAKAATLEGVGEIAVEVWSIGEISYERVSAAALLDLGYLSTRASDTSSQ